MDKRDLKLTGIIAAILTFAFLGAWLSFSKLSLGIDYNPANWPKYNIKKDSVIDSRIIILKGTSGAEIIFGSSTGAWVGTPTDSTLARIGLNTGTGKLEFKNAGTETARTMVKYHDDLAGITANQHHNQVHGAADHTGNIGAESQITFGTQSGHAHTGTDSTKVSYTNLLNRSHGAADHTGAIGAESQITFGTQSGHAHTGTDSTKVSYANLLNRSHGATDHVGTIGAESQITFGTQSGHAHNGIDSAKIDYATAPVRLGTDTLGNSDDITEGNIKKYYSSALFNSDYGLKTKWKSLGIVGTGTINFVTTGDATHTASYNAATGEGTISVTISGSATAKSDIREGGTTTVANSSFVNFNAQDFDISPNGSGANVDLSPQITDLLLFSAQALCEIERQRAGTQTYKHYGNLVVDGLQDFSGLSNFQYGTYSAISKDIRLKNYFISYETTDSGRVLGNNAGPEYRIAQSFTVNDTQQITGAKILFGPGVGSPSGSVTIKIETNSAGNPSGNLADSNLITSIIPEKNQWNTWTFTSQGTLTSGVYWIRLYCNNQSFDINWNVKDDTAQPYPNGTETYSSNGGSSWTPQARDLAFKIIEGSSTGSVQSQGFTLPSNPTKMGCALKLLGTSTNITVDLSRDNGTTYTSCPLIPVGSGSDYYRSTSLIDVSGQPSGNVAKIKILFGSETTTRVQGYSIFAK